MTSKYVGQKFGKLTVVDAWTMKTVSGAWKQKFKVRCDCGCEYDVNALTVVRGESTKCASCHKAHVAEVGKRGRRHPLYTTWWGIVQRCYSKGHYGYQYYGGVGVAMSDRWRGSRPNGERATIDGFQAFVADMGDRPSEGLSIDRIDPNGDYEPGNCRWATDKEQTANKRAPALAATVKGKTMLVADWARKLGVNPKAVRKLIKSGMTPELALVTAAMRKKEWERTKGVGADYAGCQAKAEAWLRKNS